jgi:hypothetical protein
MTRWLAAPASPLRAARGRKREAVRDCVDPRTALVSAIAFGETAEQLLELATGGAFADDVNDLWQRSVL